MRVYAVFRYVLVVSLVSHVAPQVAPQADFDEENFMKDMADKLNMAIKDSVKPVVVDAKTQALLDEFDIELGGVDDDTASDTTNSPSAEALQSKWSGHGDPFGSVGPRASDVETSESNIKPTSFINRYLYKKHPVLLHGVLSTSPALKSWDTAYLSNAPPAAMANVSAYDSSVQQLPQKTMSMRDFIMSDNKDLFIFGEIPSFLMKDLAFPHLLKCDALFNSLKRHFMTYYKLRLVTEPVVMSEDRLICSVVGRPSYVLVPSDSWQSLARNESSINYAKVNYDTHPWLKQLKYLLASQVQPADCLYAPAGWYVQSTYPDIPSLSVTFTWAPQLLKASKASCGKYDLKTDYQFEDYSSLFTEANVEHKSSSDALIHYFVFYLGEHLSSSFTTKQFVRKLKRDDKMVAKLVNWTEEVEEISRELFELLDVNEDGKFSLDDVINTSSETRKRLASQIHDRLQDMGAIMSEQQNVLTTEKNKQAKVAESATTAAKPKQKKEAAPDDIAQAFKDELNKEVEKMIKELEEKERKEQKAAASRDRASEGAKAKDQSNSKTKAKSQSKGKANVESETKSRQREKTAEHSSSSNNDKYTLVNDDEIEILAEEDVKSGEPQLTNQKQASSSSDKPAGTKASGSDKTAGTKASSSDKTEGTEASNSDKAADTEASGSDKTADTEAKPKQEL